jgi:hypothetical protein
MCLSRTLIRLGIDSYMRAIINKCTYLAEVNSIGSEYQDILIVCFTV